MFQPDSPVTCCENDTVFKICNDNNKIIMNVAVNNFFMFLFTFTLNSLDNIRKEIHLKFKHLTDQEMRVFSVLYGLEEQNMEITYKTLSIKLFLSESSIRDYINKLINKGIPIEKMKKDNKIIYLKISNELKDLVSLSSILELRSL